ncbi:hypothetical protein CPB85DRAFT_1256969 [Mucidula mucida]|nr:hypothetical protein CPB85DRAFT_1256969 [Mucidula mucida]
MAQEMSRRGSQTRQAEGTQTENTAIFRARAVQRQFNTLQYSQGSIQSQQAVNGMTAEGGFEQRLNSETAGTTRVKPTFPVSRTPARATSTWITGILFAAEAFVFGKEASLGYAVLHFEPHFDRLQLGSMSIQAPETGHNFPTPGMPPQIELAKRDQGTRLLLLLLHAVLAPAGQSPLYRDSSSFREDWPLCNLCATRPTTRRKVVPIFSWLLLEYGFSNVYRVRWPRRPGVLFLQTMWSLWFICEGISEINCVQVQPVFSLNWETHSPGRGLRTFMLLHWPTQPDLLP